MAWTRRCCSPWPPGRAARAARVRLPSNRVKATVLAQPVSTIGSKYRECLMVAEIFVSRDAREHQPEHPGAAHYLIHSYDYPPLAEQGLPAAQRYSKIAPAAAHAQHMPSHIFTRVGAWNDSVAAKPFQQKSRMP